MPQKEPAADLKLISKFFFDLNSKLCGLWDSRSAGDGPACLHTFRENGYCTTVISALGDETLTCNLSVCVWGGVITESERSAADSEARS